eukprot:1147635-Pelagomonas_calceolata.AAC.11
MAYKFEVGGCNGSLCQGGGGASLLGTMPLRQIVCVADIRGVPCCSQFKTLIKKCNAQRICRQAKGCGPDSCYSGITGMLCCHRTKDSSKVKMP